MKAQYLNKTFVGLLLIISLYACNEPKRKVVTAEEPIKGLTPLEQWKKHAEEQRAWQTTEGLFIGNATYLESTGHFLVPVNAKPEIGDEHVDQFLSSIKSDPIYESPYQVRWQVSNKGRKMLQLPELNNPLLFKVGEPTPISVEPYKVEVFETMIDASLAQSFSPVKKVKIDPAGEYYIINKNSIKMAKELPDESDELVMDMRVMVDSSLEDITVNLQTEFVDGHGNRFGFINYSGLYEGSPYTYSAFCYEIYGIKQKVFQRGRETIHRLIPTILLISDQPVFIAEFRMDDTDYIGYYPMYFRNFDYYDYTVTGFLHD